MSKIKCSLFAKVTAIFLSILLLVGTAACAVCVILMGTAGAYTGEYTYFKDAAMESILRMYAYEIVAPHSVLAERYADCNFYYTITADDGSEPITNYGGQPYVRTVTIEETSTIFTIGDTKAFDIPTTMTDETTTSILTTSVSADTAERIPVTVTYTVTLYEKEKKDASDILSIAEFWLDLAYKMRYTAIPLALCGLTLFIFVLVFLFAAAGHHRDNEKAALNYVDRIPFDLYTVICAAITISINALGILVLEAIAYSNQFYLSEEIMLMIAFGCGVLVLAIADYLILLGYSLSFATRVKVGGLIRRTLIFRILAFLWRGITIVFNGIWTLLRSIPLIPKTALIVLGVSLVELILLLANLWEGDTLLILWLLEKAMLCPLIIWIAVMLRRLKRGGEAIAAGRLQEKIDTRYMPSDFGRFGQTLNHIGDGLGHAVDERMKSERMKTELITNVSHDIKTPLTSIVNYVDLIKKEEPESETMREYISVLERQAARLKKLIEDLVEASKASSGTLSVEMARCEVGVLLEQTLGEYEEKLSERGLTPVVSAPEKPIFIMADGRRLWRVFDNLLNNICKYAQTDTRVYITLEQIGHRAVITFRNISKEALNISSDELMERFVRGDSSRNTDGSGLGLSIARSLTELQNGHLALSIDGDLFKAIVSFETME